VTQVIPGVYNQINLLLPKRTKKAHLVFLPRGQVYVADLENADGVCPFGQDLDGLLTNRIELTLDTYCPNG
jgi:hypothetical protein